MKIIDTQDIMTSRAEIQHVGMGQAIEGLWKLWPLWLGVICFYNAQIDRNTCFQDRYKYIYIYILSKEVGKQSSELRYGQIEL